MHQEYKNKNNRYHKENKNELNRRIYSFDLIKYNVLKGDYADLFSTELELAMIHFLNNKGGEIVIGIKKGSMIYGMPEEIKDSYNLFISHILVTKIRPLARGLIKFYFDDNGRMIIKIKEGVRKPYYIVHKFNKCINKMPLEQGLINKEVDKA